jgi:hypothetical protein
MKIALKPLLVFVGLLILLGGGWFVFKNFKTITPPTSLLIEIPYAVSVEAFLDDQSLGAAPLQKEGLPEGEHILKLISGEQIYQAKIQLLGGTQTVVRREFGPTDVFSAGELIWFEKTGQPAGLSLTSDPDGVKVKIDGKEVGQTPLLVEDIETGIHDLHLSLEKFETRQISIRLENGYRLRVSSKIPLLPFPATEPAMLNFGDEKTTVCTLSPTETVFTDPASLAKGIIYWVRTRGLGAVETKLDYFVDAEGVLFNSAGEVFEPANFTGEAVEKIAVGYLGKAGDSDLSEPARASLVALTKKVLKTPPLVDKARILPTGTGWLRVRAEPSLSSAEVTKINVGESFEILAEQEGWIKIKLADGGEGWVSSSFIEKFQEAP